MTRSARCFPTAGAQTGIVERTTHATPSTDSVTSSSFGAAVEACPFFLVWHPAGPATIALEKPFSVVGLLGAVSRTLA